MSDDALARTLDRCHRIRAAVDGVIVQIQGEVIRREGFRRDGASSSAHWQVERFGLAPASARAYDQVAEKAMDLPHLTRALGDGEISLDKMRTLAAVATPENDEELAKKARSSSIHELDRVVRSLRRPSKTQGAVEWESRSLRLNEACRSMSVLFPSEDFTAIRARIEATAKSLPSDGTTPWDRRCYDAFVGLLHTASSGGPSSDKGPPRSPYVGVFHAPLDALIDGSGDPSDLAGDLERGGFISLETVQRLACDATFVLAVDDADGHTMYEGRARRLATATQRREIWRRDRSCRFPGCRNAVFTEPHHVKWWRNGGYTDLPNLALLCKHHHTLVHSKGWQLTGNANEILRFVGPSGRVMTSEPSILWTAVSHRGKGRKP